MSDQLPNELFIKIFFEVLYHTSYKELAKLRRTSKRWRDCINVVIRDEIMETYGLGKSWWCWIKVSYFNGEGGFYTHNSPISYDNIDDSFCFKVSEILSYPKKIRKISVEFCNNKIYLCSKIIIKVSNLKDKNVYKNDFGSVHFIRTIEGTVRLDFVKVKDNIVYNRVEL